jgi:hypothetical protein
MLLQARSMPQAGLLDVAMIKASASYARKGARIVDEKVISRIQVACERLGIRFNGNSEEKPVKNKPEDENDFPRLEDLIRARERGKRNGRYYKLKKRGEWAKKGLFDASIAYLQKGYRIVSSTLKKALESTVEMLEPATGPITRNIILKKGREKAAELVNNFRSIMSWAPQLSNWLKSEAYILWLGITQITSPT